MRKTITPEYAQELLATYEEFRNNPQAIAVGGLRRDSFIKILYSVGHLLYTDKLDEVIYNLQKIAGREITYDELVRRKGGLPRGLTDEYEKLLQKHKKWQDSYQRPTEQTPSSSEERASELEDQADTVEKMIDRLNKEKEIAISKFLLSQGVEQKVTERVAPELRSVFSKLTEDPSEQELGDILQRELSSREIYMNEARLRTLALRIKESGAHEPIGGFRQPEEGEGLPGPPSPPAAKEGGVGIRGEAGRKAKKTTRDLVTYLGVQARELLTNPRFSWVRISIGGVLILSAAATPAPLIKLALGGSGAITLGAETIRSRVMRKVVAGGAKRGTLLVLRLLLLATGSWALPALFVLLLILTPIVGVSLFLTKDRMVKTAAFLEHGGFGVPVDQLPPGFEPPTADPSTLTFSWPVGRTPECTSPYGWRFLFGTYHFHAGIDVKSQFSPVFPIAEGAVLKMGYVSLYGNYILVQHAEGLFSLYGHLSYFNFSLREGDRVTSNTSLGASGSSGASTGPHVHLGVSNLGGTLEDFTPSRSTNPCSYLSSFCAQSPTECVNLTK